MNQFQTKRSSPFEIQSISQWQKCNFTITFHYMNAAGINRINKDIVHSEDIVDIPGLSEAATGGVL